MNCMRRFLTVMLRPDGNENRLVAQRMMGLITAVVLTGLPTAARAQNWTRVSAIPPDQVYAVAEHDGVFFASTDSIISSSDGGSLWGPTPMQPGSMTINSLFANGTYLYVGSMGDGVFRTSNRGESWENISNGLDGFARRISQFAARGDSLYAGTDGDGIYVLNLLKPPQ